MVIRALGSLRDWEPDVDLPFLIAGGLPSVNRDYRDYRLYVKLVV